MYGDDGELGGDWKVHHADPLVPPMIGEFILWAPSYIRDVWMGWRLPCEHE